MSEDISSSSTLGSAWDAGVTMCGLQHKKKIGSKDVDEFRNDTDGRRAATGVWSNHGHEGRPRQDLTSVLPART